MTPTPPPPGAPLGLPLAVWTNLPLLVCLIFGVAIFVGFVFIIRENRRVAAKNENSLAMSQPASGAANEDDRGR